MGLYRGRLSAAERGDVFPTTAPQLVSILSPWVFTVAFVRSNPYSILAFYPTASIHLQVLTPMPRVRLVR
jgi:hypothetical protein